MLIAPGVNTRGNGFCLDDGGNFLYNMATQTSIQQIDIVSGDIATIPVPAGNVMQCVKQDSAIYFLTDAPSVIITGGSAEDRARGKARIEKQAKMRGGLPSNNNKKN